MSARAAECAPEFVPVVRYVHPPGHAPRWHAGLQRVGASRPGSLCRHSHPTEDRAYACAERQADARGVTLLRPDD